MDRSEVIGNGKGLLDEKGLEEKVLEEVAIATGERDTITTGEGCYGEGDGCYGDGEGCYGDRRWLLWGWEMVAMVTWRLLLW